MARNDPQVNFRIPAELKERIELSAKENNRSITSELVNRLEGSFESSTIQSLINDNLIPSIINNEIVNYAQKYNLSQEMAIITLLDKGIHFVKKTDWVYLKQEYELQKIYGLVQQAQLTESHIINYNFLINNSDNNNDKWLILVEHCKNNLESIKNTLKKSLDVLGDNSQALTDETKVYIEQLFDKKTT